jgi:uncharacterized protein (DUF58 family)
MTADELWQQVRILEIRTKRDVSGSLAGRYRSSFKGRGIELDEVREYVQGDEIRDIDWNVTARTGRLHSRRYVEERQLTVLFAVDMSASLIFGTAFRKKNEVAAEVCAMLAFSALRNNDNVGWLLFTDRIERFVPPRRRTSNALQLIRELFVFKSSGKKTDLGLALDYLGRVLHRRCLLFVVSDFLDDSFAAALRRIAARHETIAVQITDPCESSLPCVGLVETEDLETGQRAFIDTSNVSVRDKWNNLASERNTQLNRLFGSARIDIIRIDTHGDTLASLLEFFHTRQNAA